MDTNCRQELEQAICWAGAVLHQRQFVVANEGNITARLEANRFLCTPTQTSKADLVPAELAVIDSDGVQISGPKPRSSEALAHLAVYRLRSDVQCIIHCHAPHATAFALTGTPVPSGISPEVELFLGEIPTVPYATPGTVELGEQISHYCDDAWALILANHGVLVLGSDVRQALWRTEILEAYCRNLILARTLGPLQALTPEQCEAIRNQRAVWGL